jgi:hypothetical protein
MHPTRGWKLPPGEDSTPVGLDTNIIFGYRRRDVWYVQIEIGIILNFIGDQIL